MGPNNLPPGYQQKNQEYANLSTFSRSQMMRWVLEKAPFIHYSKIDPFIALFETDERNLMMNPGTLYRMMIQYFGKENGDIAFHRFKAVVGNFLPPTQGFGNNPWYPDPNAGGQMNQPSGVSYYEAVGAIPIGMNPNSQDAKRYIMEYEQKRREKMERKEQQEEFTEQIKNLMNMKMLEVADPKSGGVGAKGPANMDHLVAAGIVRAVVGTDEKGNAVMKYEPIANPLYAQMAQGQATNSSGNQIEWARLMIETFSTVMTKQSEMPKFAESLLNNFIQKMPMQTDPIEQIVNTKKVLDTIAPQAGAGAMNLDVAKYNLAQERLKTDEEFAMMAAQREHEKMMYERQRDERMEQASSQNMSEIVKSVFSIGKEAFVPLLMMLTQGRMPGGGIPGMPGMVPEMMPGAGIPPQQAQQPAPTPQPIHRAPRPRPRPASNDEFGYGRPQTVQPQQQLQQQVVANNSGTVRQYSPQDFANMDLNTLENLKLKGANSRASIDSFNSALQAAIAQKRLEARQSPNYEPITQYEPPQQEYTEQTTTTSESITTDPQTVQDLREASGSRC